MAMDSALVQALATGFATGAPQGLIEKETEARFQAQTGYAPGEKLDPTHPADKAMLPVWADIFGKVKREADDDKLVLTYNHPVVAQNLADAGVAHKAAGEHLEAAAGAPTPEEQQQHVAAAATATEIHRQKTREAAALQPPTVSPRLAHEAAHKSDAHTRLVQETNARFWQKTNYKPGQRLDPKDPHDREMIPVWLGIYDQVRHEHAAGAHGVPSPRGRDHLAHEQVKRAPERAAEVHHDHHRRGRRPVRSTVSKQKLADHRARAMQAAHAAGAPFVLVIERPNGALEHHAFSSRAELDAAYAQISEHHDQFAYVGAFDVQGNHVVDSVGVPAAEHAEVPPTSTEIAPSGAPTGEPSIEAPKKKKLSTVAIVGIAVGAIAGVAAIAYVATRRDKSAPRARARTPKVIVATPASATPGFATRALRP